MSFGLPPPYAAPNSPANNTSKPGNPFMKLGQFLARKVTQLFANDSTSSNKIAKLVERVSGVAKAIFSASLCIPRTPSPISKPVITRSANSHLPPLLAPAAAGASSAGAKTLLTPQISPMASLGARIEVAGKQLSSSTNESAKEKATNTLLELITNFKKAFQVTDVDYQKLKADPTSARDVRVIAFSQVEEATKLLLKALDAPVKAPVKAPAPSTQTPKAPGQPSLLASAKPRLTQQALAFKDPAALLSARTKAPTSDSQISFMASLGARIEVAGKELSSSITESAKEKAPAILFDLIHKFRETESFYKMDLKAVPGSETDQVSYATALSQVEAAEKLLLGAPVKAPAPPRHTQKASGTTPYKTPYPADGRGVIDVPGDGDCLYHSMAIGLSFLLPELQKLGLLNGCILPANGGTIPDVPTLRTLANNYIRAHHARDPALRGYVGEAIVAANKKYEKDLKTETASINTLLTTNAIAQTAHAQQLADTEHKYRPINNPEEYFVRAMEEPAFWGSQAEFYALSRIYKTTIQIIDTSGNDLIQARPPVNPEYATGNHPAVRLVLPGGHFQVLTPTAKVREVPEEDRAAILAALAVPDE